MKTPLYSLIPLSILACSANAATIVSTNFDTALPNPRPNDTNGEDTLTNLVWTGDDLVNVSPSTSASYSLLDGDAGAVVRGYHGGTYGNQAFAPDINVQNYSDWAATFTFDLVNGYTGTLTDVSFDYQAMTNTGGLQGGGRAVPFNVSVNGTAFDTTKSTSSSSASGSFSFTDVESLTTGTNTVVISTDFYTNSTGWNMGIDDLVLTGDLVAPAAIPEPSSCALLGFGGFALLLRRRRK